jgi:hypothetical protein
MTTRLGRALASFTAILKHSTIHSPLRFVPSRSIRLTSTLPLPPGYTFYPLHNDGDTPPTPAMSIYTSHHPAPPLPRQSIFEYLFPSTPTSSYARQDKQAVSYIDAATGRSVTRGDLEVQAKRLATGLRGVGMKRGDVACIFGLNSLEWINAMFGSQAAGLRVSPANYG